MSKGKKPPKQALTLPLGEAALIYDEMMEAIGRCHDIREAKLLADKAALWSHYQRMSGDREPEKKARELRYSATRKLGQLIIARPLVARPDAAGRLYPFPSPSLAELGISIGLANSAREWARLSDEDFAIKLQTGKPLRRNMYRRARNFKFISGNPFEYLLSAGRMLTDADPNELLAQLSPQAETLTRKELWRLHTWLTTIRPKKMSKSTALRYKRAQTPSA